MGWETIMHENEGKKYNGTSANALGCISSNYLENRMGKDISASLPPEKNVNITLL